MNKTTTGDNTMAYCRFMITFEFDEITTIKAPTYEAAVQRAQDKLLDHFIQQGEYSKAYIFQDHLQIATITL